MRRSVGSAVIVVAGVASLLIGKGALLAFAMVVAALVAGEFFRLARARGARPLALIGLAGTVAALVVAYVRGERAPAALPGVLAAVLGACFITLLVRRDRREVTRALMLTVMGVLIAGVLSAHIVALRSLAHGFRLVAVLAAMCVAAEVAPGIARAVRARGRHAAADEPLWQRLVFAIVGTVTVGAGAALAADPPFTSSRAIVLGVLVALAVSVAPAVSEMIEAGPARDEQADADAGAAPPRAARAAPARMLRRLDGLLVASPIFFYAYRMMAR